MSALGCTVERLELAVTASSQPLQEADPRWQGSTDMGQVAAATGKTGTGQNRTWRTAANGLSNSGSNNDLLRSRPRRPCGRVVDAQCRNHLPGDRSRPCIFGRSDAAGLAAGGRVGHRKSQIGRPLHHAAVVYRDGSVAQQCQAEGVNGCRDRPAAVGNHARCGEGATRLESGPHRLGIDESGRLRVNVSPEGHVHGTGDVPRPGAIGCPGSVEAVGRQRVDHARARSEGIDDVRPSWPETQPSRPARQNGSAAGINGTSVTSGLPSAVHLSMPPWRMAQSTPMAWSVHHARVHHIVPESRPAAVCGRR